MNDFEVKKPCTNRYFVTAIYPHTNLIVISPRFEKNEYDNLHVLFLDLTLI